MSEPEVDNGCIPFEGVEKRLIISFRHNEDETQNLEPTSSWLNPLAISEEEWKCILDETRCEIVSEKSLEDHRVFLLSESTLTVWPHGFLLKTCGRTLPLLGLLKFLRLFDPGGTRDLINWIIFSRLEFLHAAHQQWPHQTFDQEKDFFRTHISPTFQNVQKNALHQSFHLLFASFVPKQPIQVPNTAYWAQEFLMTGIGTNSVKCLTGFEQPNPAGASKLENFLRQDHPDCKIALDEHWFEPCGYSANALGANIHSNDGIQYFSCHVSPEEATSYASLEIGREFKPAGHSSSITQPSQLFPLEPMIKEFSPNEIFKAEVFVVKSSVSVLPEPGEAILKDAQFSCVLRFAALDPLKFAQNVQLLENHHRSSSCHHPPTHKMVFFDSPAARFTVQIPMFPSTPSGINSEENFIKI